MNVPEIKRRDVFAPANFVSVVGLVFTLYGAFHITSLTGVIFVGVGRFIDVFDGIVARSTHASPFGALVDATCDKIGIAVLLSTVWIADLAPYWLLIYIALQNIMSITLNWLTASRDGEPKASKDGKYTMFLQNLSLGSYALGNVIDFRPLTVLGLCIGIVSMYWAARAIQGYVQHLPSRNKTTDKLPKVDV